MDHHQLAAALLARPEFDVIAWIDPVCDGGIPTDSDEALVTGRDAIFDSCQCLAGGAR